MSFIYSSKKENFPELEPIVGDGEGIAVKKVGHAGVVERVERLRGIRESKGEDRTIRLADAKSAGFLSLLFPGLGQIYMNQKSIGAAFIVANVALMALYLFLGGILTLKPVFASFNPAYDFHMFIIVPVAIALLSGISIHMAFGLSPELRLAKLITANRSKNLYWLALIFPGYGQLLNGQPKKGVFFSSVGILGMFAVASIFFTYSINWHEYTEELGVRYVEKSLILFSATAIVAAVFYVISLFDALVVRRYPYLKRPFLSRLKLYFGLSGTKKEKFALRKTSLKFVTASLVIIILGIALLTGDYTRSFYSRSFSKASSLLAEKGMTVIPKMFPRL